MVIVGELLAKRVVHEHAARDVKGEVARVDQREPQSDSRLVRTGAKGRLRRIVREDGAVTHGRLEARPQHGALAARVGLDAGDVMARHALARAPEEEAAHRHEDKGQQAAREGR